MKKNVLKNFSITKYKKMVLKILALKNVLKIVLNYPPIFPSLSD